MKTIFEILTEKYKGKTIRLKNKPNEYNNWIIEMVVESVTNSSSRYDDAGVWDNQIMFNGKGTIIEGIFLYENCIIINKDILIEEI